jgi:hypothetical protein
MAPLRRNVINQLQRVPGIVKIAAAAVAIGLLPLPYDYYILLRLLLCVVCIYYLSSGRRIRDWEKWLLTGLAVLHNPIVPIELGSRPLWSSINVGTVVWFFVLSRRGG